MASIYFNRAREIVHEAGINLRSHFGVAIQHTFKNQTAASGVTELDQSTERFLIQKLGEIAPDIGFKGEEYGIQGNTERFWLMDPIDGTTYFARGIPGCTTMLALVEEGDVVFSVIYDFMGDKMYYAEKGKGAFRNKEPIRVSDRSLSQAFMYLEVNVNKPENTELYMKLFGSCMMLGPYPAGIHLARVAEGKVDGYICKNPFGKDHDFAPGTFLIREAGGTVTNLGSSGYDYRNLDFVAANQNIYTELTTGDQALLPRLS